MTEISTENPINSLPLSRIQKLIGERMLLSKQTKPCFYLTISADVTEMLSMRPKLRKSLGIKITTNCFYISSLAKAALKYPLTLGKLKADCIEIPSEINVGFAVNAPQGLVVPIVKNAHQKTLAQIAREEKLLTDKARDNQLTLDDIQGETIAMSNLGAYDVDSFIGIVPPPASTILAIGKNIPTVTWQGDHYDVRKIIALSIAVDHRVINGDYAAQFLKFIKQQLENPKSLL